MLGPDFLRWQISSLACPLRNQETSLFPLVSPKARAKMAGIVNKVRDPLHNPVNRDLFSGLRYRYLVKSS